MSDEELNEKLQAAIIHLDHSRVEQFSELDDDDYEELHEYWGEYGGHHEKNAKTKPVPDAVYTKKELLRYYKCAKNDKDCSWTPPFTFGYHYTPADILQLVFRKHMKIDHNWSSFITNVITEHHAGDIVPVILQRVKEIIGGKKLPLSWSKILMYAIVFGYNDAKLMDELYKIAHRDMLKYNFDEDAELCWLIYRQSRADVINKQFPRDRKTAWSKDKFYRINTAETYFRTGKNYKNNIKKVLKPSIEPLEFKLRACKNIADIY